MFFGPCKLYKTVCAQQVLLLVVNCQLLNLVSPKSFVFSQFHIDLFLQVQQIRHSFPWCYGICGIDEIISDSGNQLFHWTRYWNTPGSDNLSPMTSTKQRRTQTATWTPPQDNWYMINFDGATFADDRSAGLGVVIRNKEGRVMASLSQKIPLPISVIEVEVLAARRALELAV